MKENMYRDIYKMLVDKLKNRLMELQSTNLEEIINAWQTFNKAMVILKAVQFGTEDEKVLGTLGSLTFIGKDEIHEDYKYELYISAKVSEDEVPEIVLKNGRVGNFVSYLKKSNNGTEPTETFYMSSDKFYEKYRKFTEYLKQAYFQGRRCSVKETSSDATLLYFYENIIKVGNIEETFIKIDSIISLAESLTEEDYTIKDFYNYLGEMIDGKDEIKYKIDGDSANNVKLMTIHSSKGLQFSLCYFLGYDKTFNIDDIKKTIYFDNKYGIIMPYYDEGLDTIITKELAKKNYIEDEISEKIRLLYVALTRAKEKMIIVSQIDDKEKYDTVPNSIKKNYRCFKDIISSTNSVVSDTKIVSNYVDVDYIKRINKSFENIKCDKKMEFVDLKLSYNLCDEKHYSKVASKLFTQEEIKKMEYGTKVHEMFEFDDFDNPKNKRVKEFLKLIDKPLKVYKEYEFISDNTVGVIDLLLEYSDYYMIVDYKLKNISDDEYKKQINGYKKYIEKVTSKDVYTYLYSIIDNKLLKID